MCDRFWVLWLLPCGPNRSPRTSGLMDEQGTHRVSWTRRAPWGCPVLPPKGRVLPSGLGWAASPECGLRGQLGPHPGDRDALCLPATRNLASAGPSARAAPAHPSHLHGD